jgi:hypothetical protein
MGLATPGSNPEDRAVGFELVTDLCTESDVLSRPALQGVTLSAVQLAQIPGYIGEASTSNDQNLWMSLGEVA